MNTSEIDPLEYRFPDHDIEPLILPRWSARAMSGELLPQSELLRIFEAARWAPSRANKQGWFFLYAHRDTPAFAQFFSLLDEGNQGWCNRAAVLVVILSRRSTDDGRPIRVNAFDAGTAFENLALQAKAMSLVVHPMAGFDVKRTRVELNIPDHYKVLVMMAIGRPGEIEDLPTFQQAREIPSQRKPLEEIIHEGSYAA